MEMTLLPRNNMDVFTVDIFLGKQYQKKNYNNNHMLIVTYIILILKQNKEYSI